MISVEYASLSKDRVMKSQKCKGARDLLSGDAARFRYIENVFRSSCLGWGYQEVRTPTLEYLHLFTATGTLTPGMLSKVYSFLDWDGWSGERVVLRPDGTIPVARLYIDNLAHQEIARLFYVTNIFAFEETGKQNRERWQCGVELMGVSQPIADVEMIMLASDILHVLGIDNVDIRLSHASMLKSFVKELQLNPDEEAKLLTQILDGNWQILTQTKLGDTGAGKFLSLLLDLEGRNSSSLDELKSLPWGTPDLKSKIDNFAETTRLLDALGCNYQIDISSTRGFEYYTGLCFQFVANGNRIGSGGRYDDLIPLLGGKNTPACGFALHVDPLTDLLKLKVEPKADQGVLVRSQTAASDSIKSCFHLTRSLRSLGYIAELDFTGYQSNWRWIVNLQANPPTFTVIDQVQNHKRQATSIAEVVNIIGGSG